VSAWADGEIAEAVARIEAIKTDSPLAAVDLAIESARRCARQGNARHAAMLDLAAGELLLELGEVTLAAAAIEPAWSSLGRPVDNRAAVITAAALWVRQGRVSEAVDLVERSIAVQSEPREAALLRGDLGAMLGGTGERVQASRLLASAAADQALEEALRTHFSAQLAVLRSEMPPSSANVIADVLDRVDADLNEMGALFLEVMPGKLNVQRQRMEALIRSVEGAAAQLGPAQLARLAMVRGGVAFFEGDRVRAEAELADALAAATTAGDSELVRWVSVQSQALLDPAGDWELPASSSPIEQLGALTNRAAALLESSPGAALQAALAAVRVVDGDRHQLESVADRRAWTALAERAYEVALACCLATNQLAEFVEILERLRAQGSPREPRLLAGSVAPVGERPVAPPVIASPAVTAESTDEDGVRRIPLRRVAESVGGSSAWWWGAHLFGHRLYWAVASPSGELFADVVLNPGASALLDETTATFRSVTNFEDLESHPLLRDDSEIDSLLTRLATWLLPGVLKVALASARADRAPITIVWAGPPELARLPVGMLPNGPSGALVDAAAVVVAPSYSLAPAGRHNPADVSRRPVCLVLGADPDLGMLDDVVRAVAEPGSLVLGAARHVRSGTASALATPERVAELLADAGESVLVYYGHVVQRPDDPASAALSLTDGTAPVVLSADDLLGLNRHGAPWAVVLAGCSSMSIDHVGTGEWWGLATGLLWQGATHVLGSRWDVLDNEEGRRFVAVLASELRTTDSPARALRRLQERCHRQWRDTGSPSPYQWAGWSVTSGLIAEMT
jgi:hypothetical protein